MSDEEDTIVVPQAKKKIVTLVPIGNWSSDKIELNLTQPARLGRTNAAPNHPNFIPFTSKVVSRSHAEIWESEGKFYVKDAGSASGTFLNNQRLNSSHSSELHHGDHLQLGVNYTDDENQLKQDSSLRCVLLEVNLPVKPPIHVNPGFSSSPLSTGVDLNNLTNVIKVSKSRAQTTNEGYSSSPHMYPPHISDDFPGRKASNPDLQNALLKKKEVEDKLHSALQKSGSAASSVFEIKKEKNVFVVAISRVAFKINKIQVNLSGKDVFTVNTKPWETSNKLMIQDHRCQFTKTPSFEIIKDNNQRQFERYNVVHLNGNLIATIDKIDTTNVKVTPVSGGAYTTQGDTLGNYSMSFNGVKIADIEDVETSKNQKGNLSRILNVFVDSDHNHQLVLATVVILNASYP